MVRKAHREEGKNGAVAQHLQIGVLYLREQCRGERFGSWQQTRAQQTILTAALSLGQRPGTYVEAEVLCHCRSPMTHYISRTEPGQSHADIRMPR